MTALLRALMAVLVVAAAPSAAAAKPLNVVATLSTFADLAKTVGGDYVEVSVVVSPKFNPHFIEPKPSDVLKVKRADLFIHAGLDLELWRGPLLDAAGNRRVFPGQEGELDLSRGVTLLDVPDRAVTRAEGDIHLYGNPHYWLDPENAAVMAAAIRGKLAQLDPEHEAAYQRNLDLFLERLKEAIAGWKAALAPYRGRELIGYHNEWPYLMAFSGLKMEQFLEPKPGIPPTPRQIELIEQYVKAHDVHGIVQPTFAPQQAARAVAKRTGTRVIVLCQSVREMPNCSDYLAMLDYDVRELISAMKR